MSPKARAATAAAIVAASVSGAALFRSFLHEASALPGPFGTLARFGLGTSLFLLAAVAVAMAVGARRFDRRVFDIATTGLFALLVLVPALAKTAGTLKLGPDHMTLDSIVQVEIAAGFLAQGRNPYAETYHGTPLELWHRGGDMPSLHHLVYPPLPVLITLPFRELCLRTIGVYDSRFLLIPAVAAAFLLARRRWKGIEWGPFLLVVAFLNPLLLPNFHVGRWDTMLLLFWVLALEAAASDRFRTMAVMLALAALTKTTALPAGLFAAAFVAGSRREGARWLGIFAGLIAAVLLPFILWNPKEFVFDVFGATQGWGHKPYPMVDAGPFGFAGTVLALGWVTDPRVYFPFWIIQIPATLVAAAAGLRDVLRERTVLSFGLATTITTAVYLYFNRFSDAAYFGTLLAMAVIAAGHHFAREKNPESLARATPSGSLP